MKDQKRNAVKKVTSWKSVWHSFCNRQCRRPFVDIFQFFGPGYSHGVCLPVIFSSTGVLKSILCMWCTNWRGDFIEVLPGNWFLLLVVVDPDSIVRIKYLLAT
jgi:hypothetical protein